MSFWLIYGDKELVLGVLGVLVGFDGVVSDLLPFWGLLFG